MNSEKHISIYYNEQSENETKKKQLQHQQKECKTETVNNWMATCPILIKRFYTMFVGFQLGYLYNFAEIDSVS